MPIYLKVNIKKEIKINTTVTLNKQQIQQQINALLNIKNIRQQITEITEKIDNQIKDTEDFLKLIEDCNINKE